jgi:8-oxo-dGTP pyrophosphatase MutT (NUDIX family)
MFHPKPRSDGTHVAIHHPSEATDLSTWTDRQAVATVIPEGPVPDAIDDLPVQSQWAARGGIDWLAGANAATFHEPPFMPPSGSKAAAGAVVVEPHGRVWVVHPTNAFGGYRTTFPKGTVAHSASLRETALREVFEESGLLVELFDVLTDSQRSTSYTRYYLARRTAGSPADMGWESQACSLVPLSALADVLERTVDRKIAQRLQDRAGEWGQWFPGKRTKR